MSQCDAVSPLSASPGLPVSPEGDPVFPEPWAAEAFALTVHLHARGVFGWDEWARTLSREVHRPGRAEDGSDYYDCWVAALCALLISKGVAEEAAIMELQASWQRAAEGTPHGQPIALANDPHYRPA